MDYGVQAMNVLTRIIAGDPYRKTRFHDEKGNLIPFSQLFYLLVNIFFWLRTKIFHQYPELPWIPFNVINHFNKVIQKDWTMIEFGSGMSTLWYAQKVKIVDSIEHDEIWYKKISDRISSHGYTNINYQFRSEEDYANLDSKPDKSIDFIVIDGIKRSECTFASLPKLKDGGYIYLDN